MNIKKIAVLSSAYQYSSSPVRDLDPPAKVDHLLPDSEVIYYDIDKATAVQQVTAIIAEGFDVIINLCDGSLDSDTAGIEVTQTLERYHAAFTGASSAFYDPSRTAMKIAAYSAGVNIPAYIDAKCLADVNEAAASLTFPLIVKHPNSYNSIAMTPDSRVTTIEALQHEAQKMLAAYGGALIEEFIEGREFSVLVAERRHDQETAWTLPSLEVLFPPGETFKHFDLKWKDFKSLSCAPVHDVALDAALQEAAAQTFVTLNGTGYARCDFRLNANGELFLLEINPNCGIFLPEDAPATADEILAMIPGGHSAFILHLLSLAQKRRDAQQVCWAIRFDHKNGFGIFATMPIKAGDIIQRHEQRNQTIVTRDHVQRHWSPLSRDFFDRYAWPLSEDVYGIWSNNPEEWCPINHSCDPTTWLNGLDVVARRDVSPGEQLTLDYATFCGPTMTTFRCHCGAAACRGQISGRDYLLPDLQERYGEHVSSFVKHQRDTAQPLYRLIETVDGLGLASGKAWQEGDILCAVSWVKACSEPTRWTIHFSEDWHGEPHPLELRYINHSCNPNVFFDIEHNVLRALRNIEENEQLSFFYPSTEWSLAEPFDCSCGEDNCRGVIKGAQQLSDEEFEQYQHSPLIHKQRLNRTR